MSGGSKGTTVTDANGSAAVEFPMPPAPAPSDATRLLLTWTHKGVTVGRITFHWDFDAECWVAG